MINLAMILNGDDIDLPKTADDDSLISTILSFFIVAAAAVALLMMSINAFRMVISRGNPEAFGKARSGFITAIVGLILMMLTGAILRLVFEVV